MFITPFRVAIPDDTFKRRYGHCLLCQVTIISWQLYISHECLTPNVFSQCMQRSMSRLMTMCKIFLESNSRFAQDWEERKSDNYITHTWGSPLGRSRQKTKIKLVQWRMSLGNDNTLWAELFRSCEKGKFTKMITSPLIFWNLLYFRWQIFAAHIWSVSLSTSIWVKTSWLYN